MYVYCLFSYLLICFLFICLCIFCNQEFRYIHLKALQRRSTRSAKVLEGHVTVSQLLLEAGADPDLPDSEGSFAGSCLS